VTQTLLTIRFRVWAKVYDILLGVRYLVL